ncbi:MAG: hypothetical protein AAF328_01855 [Planctomycetota bacterium]
MNASNPDPHSATFSDDVQAKLDAHLDAVDAVLQKYAQSRSQRSAIVDELDGQLREMLAAKAAERDASEVALEDWEWVAVSIDPPEAYARQSIDLPATNFTGFANEEAAEPNVSRWSLVGLAWTVYGGVALTLLILLMLSRSSQIVRLPGGGVTSEVESPSRLWLLVLIPLIPGLFAPLVTTAMGILALSQIKRYPQKWCGWGLAVFDTVLFPSVVVLGVLFGVVWSAIFYGVEMIMMLNGNRNFFDDGWTNASVDRHTVLQLPAMALAGVSTAVVLWLVVRRLNRWGLGEPA